MRRKASFKAAKYGIKGAFFTFYWLMKALSKFVRYLNTIKTNALTDLGNCPDCKSMDLEYGTPIFNNIDRVGIPFKCLACGKRGVEKYSLKYINSIINEREKDETKTEGVHGHTSQEEGSPETEERIPGDEGCDG